MMRADSSKRLTVLSEDEKLALYDLPNFDDFQRAEFFAFTDAELAVADRRKGFVDRLHCLLQIGYFKAKKAFFNFSERSVPVSDVVFLHERYFPETSKDLITPASLRRHEHDAQRLEIAALFGYRLWSDTDRPALVDAAALLVRRDVTPTFVLIEILAFLGARKIVRPGYTTLQTIISDALTTERRRLGQDLPGGVAAYSLPGTLLVPGQQGSDRP